MTEEKQMEFLDRLIRNGVNIGQLIMDNHGTMEISNNMGGSGEERKPKVTEEHIARALMALNGNCLLYTSPSPRDKRQSRMPSSA